MKRESLWRALAALALIVVPCTAARSHTQTIRRLPTGRLLVSGEVSLIRGSDGQWVVSPWFSIRRGGEPVSGLDVRLEGRRLRETLPGQYAGIRITDIVPAEGGSLEFTIRQKALPAPHPLPGSPAGITGRAVIGPLAQITAPLPGTVISRSAIGAGLTVTWSGGSAPFDLGVTRPSGSAFLSVFQQDGIPGHSFTLPATLFASGTSFQVVLAHRNASFAWKAPPHGDRPILEAGSAVLLRCSLISAFSVTE